MRVFLFVTLFAISSLLLAANKATTEEGKSPLDAIRDKRVAIEQALQDEAKEVVERISKFEEGLKVKGRSIAEDSKSQIKEVWEKHRTFQDKISQLKSSSDKAWERVRAKAVEAWGDLESALYQAKKNLTEK
jgi:hypothetical protein